ncbi:MAG TPA: chorismate mutase [Acidimicrobiales bacterium]|nr:chorismate mutase [Acidimicrobiales bacterium]
MSSAVLRALRGATTCESDTPEEIFTVTQELLLAMMERNELEHDDVVSLILTTSPDLTSAFPATGARGVGFGDVPLLCASEINVPGAMPKCVRVMMHVYTTRPRNELRHVYLRKAQSLRDDLPE